MHTPALGALPAAGQLPARISPGPALHRREPPPCRGPCPMTCWCEDGKDLDSYLIRDNSEGPF